ncbi:hypothetical protein C2G38_2186207 [Gigaspora rosea]|uniref:Uncharacterized protein n=1 Tax=Gigaspora rosea TaxID=44941 RepID=A0A397V7F5_9GLOM|nr:hypothetical protein C2G38_2186207 [Gigaspora rosea]
MDFNGDNNFVAAQLQTNHINGANSEDLATRINNMSLENSLENSQDRDQPPPYQVSTNNNQCFPQNIASNNNNGLPQNAFSPQNFPPNNSNGIQQNFAYNNNNNGIPFNNNNGINGIPFNNYNGNPFNNYNGLPFNNNNGIPFNNNNGMPFNFNNNNGMPFSNNIGISFPQSFQQQNFIPMQFQQQAAANQMNNYEMFANYMEFCKIYQHFIANQQPSNGDDDNKPLRPPTNEIDITKEKIPSGKTIKSAKSRPNLRNQKSGVFKILLLGGTGTGKSTIINTVTNYFLGGTLDKPKIVIPTKFYRVTEDEYSNKHTETSFDDVTKSQTTKCSTYTFKHPDNPSSEFIFYDTPGLSDTKGVKQDDKNIQEIINTAIAAGSLSAIVIIASGTEARVTPTIKNTLVRLGNNLPDDLMANLLLVLTKCTKGGACFSIDSFTKEIAKPKKVFYMDNQAFCSDPSIWKNDEDEREVVELNWDRSFRAINDLLETVTDMSATSTQAFETMRQYRNKIKSEIAKVTQDIANIQQVQDRLEAAQRALQKTEDQKAAFANYTTTETITLKKIVQSNFHSTVCTLHLTDNIICHEGCGLEMLSSSGTDHFLGCYCMSGGTTCSQCGCGARSHYHDNVKLTYETQTLEQVLEDMKDQYDRANQQNQKHAADANNFQSNLSKLQDAANAKYEDIHNLCKELSKICSRFNFVDELHANLESMRQDARTIQNVNIRKNAEAEIARLEKLANDLSSNGNRNASKSYDSNSSNSYSSNSSNSYSSNSSNSYSSNSSNSYSSNSNDSNSYSSSFNSYNSNSYNSDTPKLRKFKKLTSSLFSKH